MAALSCKDEICSRQLDALYHTSLSLTNILANIEGLQPNALLPAGLQYGLALCRFLLDAT